MNSVTPNKINRITNQMRLMEIKTKEKRILYTAKTIPGITAKFFGKKTF